MEGLHPEHGSVGREVGAALTALMAGARYGVKIRLPHALVMTFLFRRDLSSMDKLRLIARSVMQHAGSLAAFAVVYKTTVSTLKYMDRPSPCPSLHPIVRGQTSLASLGRTLLNLLGTLLTIYIYIYICMLVVASLHAQRLFLLPIPRTT
jgi:hypothetical protein